MAVNAPIGPDRTLSYSIPPHTNLEPGQMVWVPLGPRPVQGLVFGLTDQPQVEVTRDVLAPLEPSPLVTARGLQLAHWISSHYMCSLFEAVSLMLPPGFGSRVKAYIRPSLGERPLPELGPNDTEALAYVIGRVEVSEQEAVKALGKGGPGSIRRLLKRGLIERKWELPRPGVSHRYDCYIRPALTGDEPPEEVTSTFSRAPRQAALHRALIGHEAPLLLTLARKRYGRGPVKALVQKGLAGLEWIRIEREPATQSQDGDVSDSPVTLNPEQVQALIEITSAIDGMLGPPRQFLLHGVTGSGKTEVYIRSLKRCVNKGQKGIYLVPEIALTPQTMHRLNAAFSGRVALLHSTLSVGEQFDQWWRIRDGEFDVVVGPRSALFAPLEDLGLIVIDEEHEWTYKQQDAVPRYHAREVSTRLAELSGAVVVIGSATPDVETYFWAKGGKLRLLELPNRIAAPRGARREGSGLAEAEVHDMRRELREGNRSIFSRALSEALGQVIERGEQAILFLNRRGAASVVQCRDCGYVVRCRRCSVPLTYHATDNRLICHQCNRRTSLPKACPECGSPRIRYLGLGTQRVVEDLNGLLPGVVAVRWDRDTAKTSPGHESVLERFRRGQAQVLVGTQMVAKGLHLPGVTLVGVVLADIGLNFPDFRAGERAFQLLCQVAGRAGRGLSPGRVIIQTYNPSHYAIQAAARQDYGIFYGREIQYRHQQGAPPFNRLVHMVYLHTDAMACQREAHRMGRVLRQKAYGLGLTDVEVVGPAPAFPNRARGRYRWHLILRGRNLQPFLDGINLRAGWTVDVDPVTVL